MVSTVSVSGALRSLDAVVVVPGVMGSELVDGDGVVRWGMKPVLLAQMWRQGHVQALHVTEEDAQGVGRLRATRLLRVPAYAAGLGGLEPYGRLLDAVSRTVVDSRAVLEFPYDWRLSVGHNAKLLAEQCARHLEAWRSIVARERFGDPARPRVVVVAHSMGGLVTRYALREHRLSELVDTMVTLGTPFYGAVRTVQMLATGDSPLPVPQQAAKALARTCPGIYDLLPRYRCVEQSPTGSRLMTTADLADIGGSAELADAAADGWSKLAMTESPEAWASGPVSVFPVVGAFQRTLQSVQIRAGMYEFSALLDGVDRGGDSTVYRQSAAPMGATGFALPQKHGALAKTPEALAFVVDKILGADTPPPLGTRPVGLDLPDLVQAGKTVRARVAVEDGDPVGIQVRSVDLTTGATARWQLKSRTTSGDGMVFAHDGLPPGLHRVEAKAGGFSPVCEIILVVAAND